MAAREDVVFTRLCQQCDKARAEWRTAYVEFLEASRNANDIYGVDNARLRAAAQRVQQCQRMLNSYVAQQDMQRTMRGSQ